MLKKIIFQIFILRIFELVSFMVFSTLLFASDSVSPYLDHLKKEIQNQQEISVQKSDNKIDPYIENLKKYEKLNSNRDDEKYLEKIKRDDPDLFLKKEENFYIESQKKKIPVSVQRSVIAETLAGSSELRPQTKGQVHHAFGLRYGVKIFRNIQSSQQLISFQDFYKNSAPEFALFYQYQPFDLSGLGTLGCFGMVELSFFNAKGLFQRNFLDQNNQVSQTELQFFFIPLILGVNYQFNFFSFLKSDIKLGLTTVGYLEKRSDEGETSRGRMGGFFYSGSLAWMLDSLSSSSWDLYSSFGIHHIYLTLDYFQINARSKIFHYRVSGLTLGFMFEL